MKWSHPQGQNHPLRYVHMFVKYSGTTVDPQLSDPICIFHFLKVWTTEGVG